MQQQIEEFINTLNQELAIHAKGPLVQDTRQSLIPVIHLTPSMGPKDTGPSNAPPRRTRIKF
jgi:hypothetical protein